MALFSLLLLVYAALLFVESEQIKQLAEQCVVGVEQFLLLYIIWRLYFWQYWSAA